ncbi:hypothetical protein DPEC_G00050540 [Dallia pectoralis]|uniref:Uncharacterized protein n=1 Tax=Dallia pectoralis TaxID=75939 RepID=A0ACC2HB33_DALPE|nr:hypothetical protein DPEC_G00050540 [Dallia pectoralis]
MSKEHLSDCPPSQNSTEDNEEEDEEDWEPRVCQVCGDHATGYHFHAMTCEGCKGFFRRSVKRPTEFQCPRQGVCVITKLNRRECQACRLRKCLSIGMLKELIMSDEAVETRRNRIRRNKVFDRSLGLSPSQQSLIDELVNVHNKTFDATFSRFQFRPIDRDVNPMSVWKDTASCPKSALITHMDKWLSSFSRPTSTGSSSCSSEEKVEDDSDCGGNTVFTTLPHIADLTTYMIQNIISFAKGLHSFRALVIDDQISLLKGAMFEMMQIRFNMLFNVKTGNWECGSLTYCMDDAERAGFHRHLLDPLMQYHYTLRNLQLQEVEYVLMQAISLFSPDRAGLTHRNVIDKLQEKLAIMLKMHIDSKRTKSGKHLLYPKIVACLTEMRTMNEEYTNQVLHIVDVKPDNSFDPLILEVISKDP